ncbi:hypoxanthine phosphoribosyltransferase [Tepidibacter formicigenes]|jgi:hypoxanthine phosphoribosyltransferase|uniref:Hypoxanthine phosphoribosyltransferase n=1 Tax=Tepidibacter formicigenes DSM 15518 TaxID=1123349 RepID=A0A1M6P3Z5_9FIRM|nr:hypoxanthine phosphoribosyltransferase [Tepidibacter formicigenes]SHK02648.1 hypoxanthine phosphoribosyltransferase [Tepidibacter formicigenes DSM 15518]
MYKVTDVLIKEEDIKNKVYELAKIIENDYKGEEILLVGVLKGACVFISDLMRNIDLDVSLDFMAVSSYGMSTKSSGVVKILKDLDTEIENKNVLIVEDIIDTGLTLKYLCENLKSRNPKSLKICTLLDKPERRKCDIKVDYTGFEIPDKFIVGYGIDCGEKFRNLPYIGIVGE